MGLTTFPGLTPAEMGAFAEAKEAGKVARMAAMEAETAARTPVTCECGTGPVVTLAGCKACTKVAGEAFEARLLAMPLKGTPHP